MQYEELIQCIHCSVSLHQNSTFSVTRMPFHVHLTTSLCEGYFCFFYGNLLSLNPTTELIHRERRNMFSTHLHYDQLKIFSWSERVVFIKRNSLELFGSISTYILASCPITSSGVYLWQMVNVKGNPPWSCPCTRCPCTFRLV